jgi:uncharacterized iron-regulated protein
MAMTSSRAYQVAKRGKDVANRLKSLRRDLTDFLEYNTKQAIDWAASQKPAYLEEDADGNLAGQDFSRAAMSNLIGTAAAINDILSAGHIDNIDAVAASDA